MGSVNGNYSLTIIVQDTAGGCEGFRDDDDGENSN